jgi:hypothetical protein
MTGFAAKQQRFMRAPLERRLGNLSTNLNRISLYAAGDDSKKEVHYFIHESKHFIEWTADALTLEQTYELVRFQVRLSHWQRTWDSIWDDPAQRALVQAEAKAWSERLLQWAGYK